MARAKKTSPTSAVAVPQDYEQADALMADLGRIQRDRAVACLALEEEITKLREVHGASDAPLIEREKASIDALEKWCAANRDSITKDGKVKHHHFSTGTVKWRHRPPKVTLRGVDAILAAVKESRLKGTKAFVVVRESLSKEAMLANPDLAVTFTGVTIQSDGEDFVVEPDTEDQRSDTSVAA